MEPLEPPALVNIISSYSNTVIVSAVVNGGGKLIAISRFLYGVHARTLTHYTTH